MSDDVSTPYASTHRYRPLFAAVRSEGVDLDGILRDLGFDEAELLDPTTRVPSDRALTIFVRLLACAPDAYLGVKAAERFELVDLGAPGYMLRHAAHALDGLRLLARYSRLGSDAYETTLEVGPSLVTMTGKLSGGRPFHPLALDFTAGALVRCLSLLSRGTVSPIEAQLPRPRPQRVAPYRRLFGEHVSFDAELIVLRYDKAALCAPSPDSDPQLLAILEQHAAQLLERLPAPSMLSEQLRSVIGQELPHGALSVQNAAKMLGLSERTLRRKLATAGRSYRDILDEVRREHAIAYLNDGSLSMATIAQRLGFGDATSFTRNFRRWTGRSPSLARRAEGATQR